MAHIIPSGEKGPRHKDRPDEDFDPESFENLILLHPTCHTRIDKKPELYPPELLREWKEQHANALNAKVGILKYSRRDEVAGALSAKMRENFVVWNKYAPNDGSEFENNPEADAARVWGQRMKAVIIPNHYHALSVLGLNEHLASADEMDIIAEYREHVRGLTERHISNSDNPVIRFPKAMNGIFR